MQDLRKMDDERHLQSRAIFDKQRELAQSVAMELYKEKIKSCALNSELEQYKMFYDSLQDALETPRILETVVRNAKIRKSSLSVDTGVGGDGVLGVEIDSPVEMEE